MKESAPYVRVCPSCVETVSAAATVCKFCGADLGRTAARDQQPRLNLATGAISFVGCVSALTFALFLAVVICFAVLQFGASH